MFHTYKGSQVTLGMWPEDLHLEAISGRESFSKVPATIEDIEPLGSETHIHLSTGKDGFIVRVSARYDPRPGATAQVMVDQQQS
jgi:ABC-type sugar transport system ATPase subunit